MEPLAIFTTTTTTAAAAATVSYSDCNPEQFCNMITSVMVWMTANRSWIPNRCKELVSFIRSFHYFSKPHADSYSMDSRDERAES
jgi:hypothetical protein